MKKKTTATKRVSSAKTKAGDLATLITEVRDLIQGARLGLVSVVDTFQVMTNFQIGRRIVEHEQKGAKRAAYGAEVLKELSARLTEEFGRGFSRANLQLIRGFYLVWSEGGIPICQTSSGKWAQRVKSQTVTGELICIQVPPIRKLMP
jgi:hypothetical protein